MMPVFPGVNRLFARRSCLPVIAVTMIAMTGLRAQGVPTVQQNQFRSQWVGEQVDQIPFSSSVTPLNGLGAVVGSLQTQDQVDREVQASLAEVKVKSPIVFKPGLAVGWEINNQGSQTTNTVVTPAVGTNGPGTNSYTAYNTANSPFVAPSLAVLYDREHGPWTVSAGYSGGYKYFSNQNFVGSGTGNERNPLSQTALLKAILEMSRYMLAATFTASSGTGYDISSGSNNRQTQLNGDMGMKYLLSSSAAIDAKAGYSFLNSSGSSATPNNNTGSLFTTLSPVYDLTDKTHFSGILGAGQTSQNLQAGTASAGNTALQTAQNTARSYVQSLAKVKYDITGKITCDLGLGARYVTTTGITNSIDNGLSPAWAVGLAYTPTAKTSLAFSAGVQGADVSPGINLILNWAPREKTKFSLAASQSQNFGNTVSGQYLVSRSLIGTMSQKLFSTVEFQLSGGYTQQDYVNLSSTTQNSQNTAQLPSNFFVAQASLIWNIRDWVNLSNTLYYNSQSVQSSTYSQGNNSQTWYSVALNFTL